MNLSNSQTEPLPSFLAPSELRTKLQVLKQNHNPSSQELKLIQQLEKLIEKADPDFFIRKCCSKEHYIYIYHSELLEIRAQIWGHIRENDRKYKLTTLLSSCSKTNHRDYTFRNRTVCLKMLSLLTGFSKSTIKNYFNQSCSPHNLRINSLQGELDQGVCSFLDLSFQIGRAHV